MKTSTLLTAGVVVGALVLIAKSRNSGVGDGDMLLPPPGRTITAGGQVLGDLGMETRFIDSYDANPSQYSRVPQNDFVPGIGDLGFSVSGVVKKAASSVSKTVSKAGKAVGRAAALPSKIMNTKAMKVVSVLSPAAMANRLAASTIKIVGRSISNPKAGFKIATSGLKSFTVTPLRHAGIIKPPKIKTQTSGGIEYQDAQGNVVSKEDYDKLLAASQRSVPVKAMDYKGYGIWTMNPPEGGTLYLINYNDATKSVEGAYTSMGSAQAAVDGVSVPNTAAPTPKGKVKWGVVPMPVSRQVGAPKRWLPKKGAGTMTRNQANKAAWEKNRASGAIPVTTPPPAIVPELPADNGSAASTSTPSTYERAQQAYDVMQAEREQASMSQTYDDSGYGTTQQVTEEGAPQIPETITEVQTPEAQMLPQELPAPDTSGNTKVGVLVGGGILAAIAAALAT